MPVPARCATTNPRLHIALGPLRVEVRCAEHPRLLLLLGRWARNFALPEKARADRILEVKLAPGKPEGPRVPVFLESDGRFHVGWHLFEVRGSVEPTELDRNIEATLYAGDTPDMETAVNLLVGVLQALTAELLRPLGYLVFHGAAVLVRSSLGVVAVGASGAGKTTFAAGAWVAERYSDDYALIRTRANPSMIGVPFAGRERNTTVHSRGAAGLIVFPEHGHPDLPPSIHPLKPALACERLLAHVACADLRPATFAANMEQVLGLVRKIPVCVMRYHPARPTSELLAALHSAAAGNPPRTGGEARFTPMMVS